MNNLENNIKTSNVKILQTSDPNKYKKLLDCTGETCRLFANHNNFEYIPYIGLKRGDLPWHATFNRIPLLSEIGQSSFTGWVLYMDADAYIYDLNFDLSSYLTENQRFSIIGAPGGQQSWQANAGILFFNFDHPATRDIITEWDSVFQYTLPDAKLLGLPDWPAGIPDDQAMLHGIMYRRGDAEEILKLEPLSFIGSTSSTFLRQVLRFHGTFEERCVIAQNDVNDAIGRLKSGA